MIAAICAAVRVEAAPRPRARSLNGATSVSAAAPRPCTPGLSGRPSVATPEPACTQQRVGVAVVAAVELDELRPPGGRAREAQRAHRRLGADVDEAHHLDRRQRAHDPLGELAPRARSARRSVVPQRRLPRRSPRRPRGARGRAIERAPRQHVVDVRRCRRRRSARAPCAAGDEARRAADAAERAHRAVHAAGDHALRAREQRARTRRSAQRGRHARPVIVRPPRSQRAASLA